MIDIPTFLTHYKTTFNSLTDKQSAGLTDLLTDFNNDTQMTDIRWIAYALATIKWECDDTFRPIEEVGKGRAYSYGNPDIITGQTYYGRGYVQLTWKRNYQTFENLLHIPLVSNPSLALDPSTAYQILTLGMRRGLFTGKKLSDYILGNVCDYFSARKIINGLDKASIIESFANKFELILKNS